MTQGTVLNIVAENRLMYTERQYQQAKKARELYHAIGNPSVKDFKNIVKMNATKNCPVTVEDINIAEKIFGPDVSSLKGKTTRSKPKVIVKDYIDVPKEILKPHRSVDLCIDIMYVQRQMFLVTVSKNIKLVIVVHLNNRNEKTLLEALDKSFRVYNHAGFQIKAVFADPEFKFMRDPLIDLDIKLNISAAQEHVAEIERMIRTIKERYRSMYSHLPY